MKFNIEGMLMHYDIKDITEYICSTEKDKIKELSAQINIDEDTLERYNKWYYLDGEYYYFKQKGVFRELFMEEIFKKINVNVLNHEIVKANGRYGIISKNFREKNKDYFYFDKIIPELSYNDTIKEIKQSLIKNFPETNVKQFMETIYKIISIDCLFGQIDRDFYNVVVEKDENKAILSPMFDNGLVFPYFINTDNYTYDSCFETISFDIGNYSKHTIDILGKYQKLLKSFDIAMDLKLEEIFNEMETKYPIIIDEIIKRKITEYYDNRRRITEKTLKIVR